MRVLHPAERSASPLRQEALLLQTLQDATACCTDRVRITIADRRLFLDGFVCSLSQKRGVEKTCQDFAPAATVVNRLRVAAEEEGLVS